jgi:hypothetical protein
LLRREEKNAPFGHASVSISVVLGHYQDFSIMDGLLAHGHSIGFHHSVAGTKKSVVL